MHTEIARFPASLGGIDTGGRLPDQHRKHHVRPILKCEPSSSGSPQQSHWSALAMVELLPSKSSRSRRTDRAVERKAKHRASSQGGPAMRYRRRVGGGNHVVASRAQWAQIRPEVNEGSVVATFSLAQSRQSRSLRAWSCLVS